MDEKGPWEGDWRRKLLERITIEGCSSVRQWLARYPGVSYPELAHRLGNDIAPIQIIWLARLEAETAQQDHEYALDLLVRRIREYLPRGWDKARDGNVVFQLAKICSIWSIELDREVRARASAVFDRLMDDASIPDGWLPQDTNDPILLRALGDTRLDRAR